MTPICSPLTPICSPAPDVCRLLDKIREAPAGYIASLVRRNRAYRQQPLSGVDIEKLLLARTKYFGGKIAAPMPIAMVRPPEKVS